MYYKSKANLDIDVYLGAWVELGQHGSFKRLLEVKAHFCGLAVSVRSPLPLRRAEGGHAVLAVDNGSVMKGPTTSTSNLNGKQEVSIGEP